MSQDGVSTGYRITNNVIHTIDGASVHASGRHANGQVTHNVCRNGQTRVDGGDQNVASQEHGGSEQRGRDRRVGVQRVHRANNQTVSYTGGSGRCGYATASPKGTASDGTDIGRTAAVGTPAPAAAGHHGARDDDHLRTGRPQQLDERVARVQLQRVGLGVRVQARQRRLRRVHEPEELQRAEHRFAHVQRARDRRGGQHRRHAGDVDVDDQRAGRHAAAGHDDRPLSVQSDDRGERLVRVLVERVRVVPRSMCKLDSGAGGAVVEPQELQFGLSDRLAHVQPARDRRGRRHRRHARRRGRRRPTRRPTPRRRTPRSARARTIPPTTRPRRSRSPPRRRAPRSRAASTAAPVTRARARGPRRR